MAKKPPAVDQDGNELPQTYDPGQFIVAPSDTRGISYRLTFRCAPDMEKAIDQILASNRFPFSTRGDVLRWCAREGLKRLEAMEPVVSVSKRIDLLSAILTEENSHAEFLDIFQQLGETVEKYLADQAPEQATRILAMAKHQFMEMPEGHWRTRYLKELHGRFGALMNGNGHAVKLGKKKYHHAPTNVGVAAGHGPGSQKDDDADLPWHEH